jgi:hypothetical protein
VERFLTVDEWFLKADKKFGNAVVVHYTPPPTSSPPAGRRLKTYVYAAIPPFPAGGEEEYNRRLSGWGDSTAFPQPRYSRLLPEIRF